MPCCIKHTAGGGTKFGKRGLHKKGGLGTLPPTMVTIMLSLYLCFNFSFSKGYVKLKIRINFQVPDFFTDNLLFQTEGIIVFQSPQLLYKFNQKYS